jgi:glycosyltransferase involved in cell wall biosynthesis
MKIAFIGSKGIPAHAGGIERHVEELSIRLATLGHEVFVYCRKYYTNYSEKKYKGVNLIYLPSIKSKNLDAISHTFLATLDALKKNYDIIHYHGVGPSTLSFIPRFLKRKAKVVATFHCQDKFHQKWGKIARAYLSFGEFAACKFPHQTITVSRTIKKYCKEMFNKEAEYVPNGASVINDIGGDEEIKKFGLEKDKYIMTCARLVKHKGIHYLIEAFNLIKTRKQENKETRDLKLVIVGDSAHTDDYVQYLRKLASGNKDIIFTGPQFGKTLAQLFQNAYIYVHPSEAEGLPITVLEAMAYKRTVLVSNISENIEAFAGHGYMFVNKNINDLKYKIELLLQNPGLVKKTGEKAHDYVLLNYNWGKISKATLNLYSKPLISEEASLVESAQKA